MVLAKIRQDGGGHISSQSSLGLRQATTSVVRIYIVV